MPNQSITEESISESITKVISESVIKSKLTSASVSASVAKGIEKTLILNHKISTKWNGEWGKSETNSSSLTTNTESINKSIEQLEINYKFTENMKHGYYRIAMYSTIDLFLLVKLNKTNEIIKSEEIISVPKTNYIYAFEYSNDGIFDNLSKKNVINIPDNYHLSLPVPKGDKPIETSKEYLDNTQKTITDAKNNHTDIYLWSIEESLKLKEQGYKFLEITIYFEGKEENDGYQCFYLTNNKWTTPFHDSEPNNSSEWSKVFYSQTKMQIPEDNYGQVNGDGWNCRTYKTHKIDLNNLNYNGTNAFGFWIRWGAHGAGNDNWHLRNLKINATVLKD